MCAIFGSVGPGTPLQLEPLARRLTHRGPDAFGSWFDAEASVYLAHCRLSIIDLSELAAQPMAGESGVRLTYNGEIYNFPELRRELKALGHSFRSTGDTEVVLRAYEQWGEACVTRFDGMFAFAIWDSARRRLFLARDRLGIKPLYYLKTPTGIAFASEPKALLDLPGYRKSIHAPSLFCYLIYKYVSGPESIFEGISRLLPGQTLSFDTETGSTRLNTYWEPAVDDVKWTTASAVERLGELLDHSVKGCLISDVPIGVFLSGGFDSSLVTAAAARQIPRVDTYSIGFDGSGLDERPLAARTAAVLGTQHHELDVHAAATDSLAGILEYFDEPIGCFSIFPTNLLCAATRKQVKVALSGDGGDELFAGYRWYAQTEHASVFKRCLFLLGPALTQLGLGDTAWGARADRVEHYRRMTSPGFRIDELRALFPDLREHLPVSATYLYQQHYRADVSGVKRWQLIDLHTFLPDQNLAKLDRISMAHSLEVRVPYLSHHLVDFGLSLPERLTLRGTQQKFLMTKLLEREGLDYLIGQPKRGFSSPVHRYWPLAEMHDCVRKGAMVTSGFLDGTALERVLAGDDTNRDFKVWLLAVLELWFRRWAL